MRGAPVHGTILSSSTKKNPHSLTNTDNAIAKKFQQALTAASDHQTVKSPAPHSYTIKQGDTLSKIVAAESRKLGLTPDRNTLYTMVNQVAKSNKLSNPDRIFAGQHIDLSSLSQTAAPVEAKTTTPEALVTLPSTTLIPVPATLKLQAPVNGTITSLFGTRKHPILGCNKHHDGIDISQPKGTPVVPMASGTVSFVGNNSSYGLMVDIDHGNGLTSRYAHLDTILVHQGDKITPDKVLGHVGSSGMTTGPHLHLEIHQQDIPVDPLTFIARSQIETGVMMANATLPAKL